MMNKKRDLGLVGFGAMGKAHARQLQHLNSANVRVVVESNPRGRESAVEFYKNQDVQIFENLDEAFKIDLPLGWVVASSTDSHIPLTKKLLEAGSTVLLEKPIASTFAEARELHSLVQKDSANLMMGHILLWHREFLAFKGALLGLGKLRAIRASRQRSQDHRLKYPSESPLTLTMIHDLYSVYSLISGATPNHFSAQHREHVDGGIDLVHAQLVWDDNLFASFEANFLIPNGINGGGNIDELSAACDHGMVRLSYESGMLNVIREGSTEFRELLYPANPGVDNFFDDALRSELQFFIELLEGRALVPIGARYQDACDMQQWIENLKQSSESGVTQKC